MQTVVGNLTADAKISATKDGRKVVNFTIAENSRFKVKGSGEIKKVTNFYNCSYWMGTGIVNHLKKGMLIETAGRIGVNAWQGMNGEAKASLNLHVQFIQLHGKSKHNVNREQAEQSNAVTANDDLPF